MFGFIIQIALILVVGVVGYTYYSTHKDNLKTSFLLVILGVIVAVLAIFGSFYTVDENEQAVVTMFGKVQSTQGAGVHFKLPFLQRTKVVDMSTHGSSIGYYTESKNQQYGADENPQIIQQAETKKASKIVEAEG